MARRAYPRRYAQAIFEIARQADELDRWDADLQKIVILVKDTEIRAFLESPKLCFSEKAKLLSERLQGINPLALNLINLLVNRGRLHLMENIAEEYHRLFDSYRGIEHADVATAVALDKEETGKLAARLSQIVGKKVLIELEVDPAIIGGMVVRVGGKLLDGSTRAKLELCERS